MLYRLYRIFMAAFLLGAGALWAADRMDHPMVQPSKPAVEVGINAPSYTKTAARRSEIAYGEWKIMFKDGAEMKNDRLKQYGQEGFLHDS